MNVIEGLSAPGCSPTPPGPPSCCLAGDQARDQLKALADPIRLQVVEALCSGERCVCELTELLGLAQSKLSFHLRVLKQAGLLVDRQQGRWTYYRLQVDALLELRGWLDRLLSGCRGAPLFPSPIPPG